MDIKRYKYNGCYEISFFDKNTGAQFGIVLEKDTGFCVMINDLTKEALSAELPKEVLDMFKAKYKLERPEIELPKLEEVEPVPWE